MQDSGSDPVALQYRGAAMVVALVAVALVLGGCASSAIADLPEWAGGLPAAAPERRAEPLAYPAVHDLPPQRDSTPLTPAERQKLQKDLAAQRDRVARQARDGRGGATAPR